MDHLSALSEPVRAGLVAFVLALHLAVIGFNIFGLIVVPIGAWRGWSFVRIFWWRALHLALLLVVALQAVGGRPCILTLMQASITGSSEGPMIMSAINRLIYWPLPIWMFAAAYVLVFAYAVSLWVLVRPSLRLSVDEPPVSGSIWPDGQ